MLCEDSEEDCEEAIALLFPSVAADWKWVSISICDYSVYLFSLFPYLSRFFYWSLSYPTCLNFSSKLWILLLSFF